MKPTPAKNVLAEIKRALALPALLVAAMVMLAPGGGTNSTEPDHVLRDQPEPESWAAVGWQQVSKTEADNLTLQWYGEDKAGARALTFDWQRSATHPMLDSLLPGVRFYDPREATRFMTGFPRHSAVALFEGKFYRLDRLNYLLRDAGFKFDTTEMAAIAKIAVLLTLLEKYPRNDSISAATAFPAVEFRKVEGGSVECLVNGVLRIFGLVTERVYRVPGRVPTRLYEGNRPVQNDQPLFTDSQPRQFPAGKRPKQAQFQQADNVTGLAQAINRHPHRTG